MSNSYQVSPYILEWALDKSTERQFDTAIDVAVGSALHYAADLRRSTQRQTFAFGTWGLDLSIDAVQRLQSEFGWPEWAAIPVGTIGAVASFAPLVFITVAPYVGPWAPVTAPIAFALDAYNIYRYFDE